MTKKQIQILANSSYSDGKLDEEKVEKISTLLSRKDLKQYVRIVKLEEKKKQVTVALPSASIYNTNKKIFLDLFPGKTVTIEEDKLLLLGGRIMADDLVYDFSLKNKLEKFIDEIEQSYE